jgi:hypothetical protein
MRSWGNYWERWTARAESRWETSREASRGETIWRDRRLRLKDDDQRKALSSSGMTLEPMSVGEEERGEERTDRFKNSLAVDWSWGGEDSKAPMMILEQEVMSCWTFETFVAPSSSTAIRPMSLSSTIALRTWL